MAAADMAVGFTDVRFEGQSRRSLTGRERLLMTIRDIGGLGFLQRKSIVRPLR